MTALRGPEGRDAGDSASKQEEGRAPPFSLCGQGHGLCQEGRGEEVSEGNRTERWPFSREGARLGSGSAVWAPSW